MDLEVSAGVAEEGFVNFKSFSNKTWQSTVLPVAPCFNSRFAT